MDTKLLKTMCGFLVKWWRLAATRWWNESLLGDWGSDGHLYARGESIHNYRVDWFNIVLIVSQSRYFVNCAEYHLIFVPYCVNGSHHSSTIIAKIVTRDKSSAFMIDCMRIWTAISQKTYVFMVCLHITCVQLHTICSEDSIAVAPSDPPSPVADSYQVEIENRSSC